MDWAVAVDAAVAVAAVSDVADVAAVAAVAAVAMCTTNMPIAHCHIENIFEEHAFFLDMCPLKSDIFNDFP